MLRVTSSYCMSGALLALLLSASSPTCAAGTGAAAALEIRVEQRIAQYHKAFPQIAFVQLRDLEDLAPLLPLANSLGADASNVDYEHPADLRQTLLDVQTQRLTQMLIHGLPSATLFRVNDAPLTARPLVCLLTMDERNFVHHPRAATAFMTDFLDEQLTRVPESSVLDNTAFVHYTLDHELFHCVDGFRNGALYPRTLSDIQSCYHHHRAELRAEIFAALAHLARYPTQRGFLSSLARIRALGLLSWDPTHYTVPALRQLAALPAHGVPNEDIVGLVDLAEQKALHLSPELGEHQRFMVAAYHLARRNGLAASEFPPETAALASFEPDISVLQALSAELQTALAAMQGP
ncbi:MAG: hypothetical protein JSW10_03175 [Pseudomonadota bacterium]|nr:MAG: hypothetical protein JSW10_03175 [Pseudomonadota bacterium]